MQPIYRQHEIRIQTKRGIQRQIETLRMEHDPLRNVPNMATGELMFLDPQGHMVPTNRYFLVPATRR